MTFVSCTFTEVIRKLGQISLRESAAQVGNNVACTTHALYAVVVSISSFSGAFHAITPGRIHAGRVAGRGRHHCRSRRDLAAGVAERQGAGAPHPVRIESP